tara:strand:+ start:914 stop:1693 length:780 start_codon:yes stop_codon:yes gene_type:complete
MLIPRQIHQIWWQGFDKVPTKYIPYLETWESNHPSPKWEIKYWNKVSFEENILTKYPEYLDIYQNLPLMIQKIDFAKYLILYHLGGIYVDVDTISEKALDLFLDKYKNPIILTKFKVFEELPIFVINNGIIMSVPKHPLLKKIIKHIDYKKEFYHPNDWYVMKSTGPYYFTKIIMEYLNNQQDTQVMIVPNDVLESCTLSDYQQCKSKGTYITHDHNCSWASNIFKTILYSIVYLKDYLKYALILLISLISICIVSSNK